MGVGDVLFKTNGRFLVYFWYILLVLCSTCNTDADKIQPSTIIYVLSGFNFVCVIVLLCMDACTQEDSGGLLTLLRHIGPDGDDSTNEKFLVTDERLEFRV